MSSSVRRHASAAKKAVIVLVATLALLGGLRATAASAEPRPDPGLSVPAGLKCGPLDDPRTISVERVGNHLVRCDYRAR